MTNPSKTFDERLDDMIARDRITLAEIVLDYCKRAKTPVPEWAIRAAMEGRRTGAEAHQDDRAPRVAKRSKSRVGRCGDD